MQQLYTKTVSERGKVTYTPYAPNTRAEIEIDNGQLATLAGTIGLCTLMGLERHLPPHALLSRKIRAAENAIVEVAKLGGKELDQRMTDAGTEAWGAAVQRLAEVLAMTTAIEKEKKC